MTNEEVSFEDWFDNLRNVVLDLCGVEFRDSDSVKDDYENGANLFDVAESIADEYKD